MLVVARYPPKLAASARQKNNHKTHPLSFLGEKVFGPSKALFGCGSLAENSRGQRKFPLLQPGTKDDSHLASSLNRTSNSMKTNKMSLKAFIWPALLLGSSFSAMRNTPPFVGLIENLQHWRRSVSRAASDWCGGHAWQTALVPCI